MKFYLCLLERLVRLAIHSTTERGPLIPPSPGTAFGYSWGRAAQEMVPVRPFHFEFQCRLSDCGPEAPGLNFMFQHPANSPRLPLVTGWESAAVA